MEAGLADIVESDHCVQREIEDGVWLQAAFGHSAGSVIVNAQRGGRQAAFAGYLLKVVGPLGLEPRTKGFTRPRRFRWEWTISSPPIYEEGCGTL